jgi:hypothetical protein
LREDPAAEDIDATGDREDGFRITSRTRARLVKATFAIAATSMPGADTWAAAQASETATSSGRR